MRAARQGRSSQRARSPSRCRTLPHEYADPYPIFMGVGFNMHRVYFNQTLHPEWGQFGCPRDPRKDHVPKMNHACGRNGGSALARGKPESHGYGGHRLSRLLFVASQRDRTDSGDQITDRESQSCESAKEYRWIR